MHSLFRIGHVVVLGWITNGQRAQALEESSVEVAHLRERQSELETELNQLKSSSQKRRGSTDGLIDSAHMN